MFKSKGKLDMDDGLRLLVDEDFILYYKWLINKYFYGTKRLQIPKHKAHSTLINPKIHRSYNIDPILPYIGQYIDFEYDPTEMYESKVNFWIPIYCEFAEELKRKCGIIENENYWGLHLTVCNTKFNDFKS